MNDIVIWFPFSLQMTHKPKTSSNFAVILPPLFYSREKCWKIFTWVCAFYK